MRTLGVVSLDERLLRRARGLAMAGGQAGRGGAARGRDARRGVAETRALIGRERPTLTEREVKAILRFTACRWWESG